MKEEKDMSIIDIMLREIEEAQRKEAQEMAARLYERTVRRRLWRRRAKAALPTLVAVAVCALLFAMAKMF